MSKLETEFCADTMLERPRYFPRQLITPAELTLEQTYFRDKLRRHNRLLHGWGVVCGAPVCAVPTPDGTEAEPWKVRIKPGYILGPYGDEIVIETEREVDLRSSGVISVCGEPPGPHVDPWCTEVLVKPQSGPVYVAVKYAEVLSRPVRVQPLGCGCNDTQCEYSRLCDGYEIGILSACPESHHNPPNLTSDGKPNLELLLQGLSPDCPQCPSDPWVVLAKVELDGKGVIQSIDNCSCRRNVISFGAFWWRCTSKTVRVDSIDPATLEPGKAVVITIKGANIDPKAEVSAGSGVTVANDAKVKDGATLTVTVNVAATASGTRLIRVSNPDCSTGTAQVTIGRPPVAGTSPAPTTPTPTTPTPTTPANPTTRPTAQPAGARPTLRKKGGGK